MTLTIKKHAIFCPESFKSITFAQHKNKKQSGKARYCKTKETLWLDI